MPVGRRTSVCTSACLSNARRIVSPGAAFEEDVVRQHHRRAAVLLEDGEDVLEEIELLVARARPEIVAVDDERFLGGLARFVDDGDAALLAEGRIGQDDVVFAVLRGERVLGHDRERKSGILPLTL